jgi:hypothetical protein
VRDISTCDDDHWAMLAQKQGFIYNGVLYNSTDDYPELAPLPPYPPGRANDATDGKTPGGTSEGDDRDGQDSGAMGIAPNMAVLLMTMAFCVGIL